MKHNDTRDIFITLEYEHSPVSTAYRFFKGDFEVILRYDTKEIMVRSKCANNPDEVDRFSYVGLMRIDEWECLSAKRSEVKRYIERVLNKR